MSSYFYQEVDSNQHTADFLEKLKHYAHKNKRLIYVLNRPLTDQKYSYKYESALIVLSPNYKIALVDFGNNADGFDNYVEDVIEDIGSISDKYHYKEIIGRARQWRRELLITEIKFNQIDNIESFFNTLSISSDLLKKKADLLISLFIGSINDIERVKEEVPITTLDKVKQKIQLFDGDQTRFVYQNPTKKRITIQGLSGTGKTELLLHKLKDLYLSDNSSSIYFTCHNRILADSLRKRIPSFFNFMKVEQQIEWQKRLWCTHAWGSSPYTDSGAYRYICAFYDIPFYRYSPQMSFSKACQLAIEAINTKYSDTEIKHAFTHMLIDESQDFEEPFFQLCELATEKNIYVAGDVFQSIFDEEISSSIEPDFLLGKCYRTDPKTLMFAHALGMGLFEKNKIRWLEEKEWRDCGYNVSIKEREYYLSREPLRRFEDFEDSFESIKIVETKKALSDSIISLINEIKKENDTLLPDDIGIIFLDQNNDIYELADLLEIIIPQSNGWEVNKAYETKEKIPGAIFISNRNNVKGLEFPFVICVTNKIKNNSSYRNSLYTMLTRSFIKSFLLIPRSSESGLTNEMKQGLNEIITNNQMVVLEPTTIEKKKIQTRFKYRQKRLSHYEIMLSIFSKLKVEKKYHSKLFEATKQLDLIENDEETLTEFVKDNLKYLKGR